MKKNLKLVFVLIFLITSAVLFSEEVSLEGVFISRFPYCYRFTILNDHEMKFEWTSPSGGHRFDQAKIYQYMLSKDSVFFQLKLDSDLPTLLWEAVTGNTEPWYVGNKILGLFGFSGDTTEQKENITGVTYATSAYLDHNDIFTIDVPYYVFNGPPNVSPLDFNNPSSELREGDRTYQLKNLYNLRSGTAWVEGAEGDGIGESFEIVFNEQPQYLALINGYISAQNPSLYWKNGRIKTVRIEGLTTGTVIKRNLEDTPHLQTIDIRELGEETHARFVIADVYPGECYADTCLHFLTYSPYPIRPLSVP